MNSLDDITLLDCTLRDGGYYNKWKFSKQLINDYLKAIKDLNIKFIEIDLENLKMIYRWVKLHTTVKFINFKIAQKHQLWRHGKYGDLVSGGKLIRNYESLFPKKVKFLYIACHEHEIF